MNRLTTEALIRKHEGVEYVAYDDSEGIRTIGIGFNLQKEGAQRRIGALGLDYDAVFSGACTLTDQHCSALFSVDLDDAIEQASGIVSNFSLQPDDVQSVIVDMVYNLGAAGFQKFTKAIAAFEDKDYCTAAAELQNSLWARQVPSRAKEDISMVKAFCNAA